MSKKPAQETSVLVKARVLVDGAFGKVNDIVEVDPEVEHGGEPSRMSRLNNSGGRSAVNRSRIGQR